MPAAARTQVLMPTLSPEVEEGVVVTWFVTVGAEVGEGDLVAEVQVEKVSAEVHAPVRGRVAELLVAPGGVVRQGAPIAVLEAMAVEEAGAGPTAAPALAAIAPAGAAAGAAPRASPAARRLARERGIDIATLTGSGPGGRIVEADVVAAAGPPAAEKEILPLSPMRRAIARRLREGLSTAAQLTLTGEADATDLAEALAESDLSWTAAAVRACALALKEHPRVGSRWSEDGLHPPAATDIGVAMALEDGLVVPVVRAVDGLDPRELDRQIADLARRARAGALDGADLEGAVMSVTSLGAHRVDAFTPLLDPPQTAILGVGRARPRPAVRDGVVLVRTLVVLSLTFDHRVLDGDPAAAFLDAVLELLERPATLLGGGAS